MVSGVSVANKRKEGGGTPFLIDRNRPRVGFTPREGTPLRGMVSVMSEAIERKEGGSAPLLFDSAPAEARRHGAVRPSSRAKDTPGRRRPRSGPPPGPGRAPSNPRIFRDAT